MRNKLLSKNGFFVLVVIYVAIQIALVLFNQVPFTSDSLRYYTQAIECIAQNSFYPGMHNLYDPYINSPLYVNYLIVLLTVSGSPLIILLFNIILNTLQLILVMRISKILFKDEISPRISGLLYMAYLTNFGLILMNMTELLFGVLTLAALYFYLKGRLGYLILSGAFIALSIGIRQIGFALLGAILTYEVYCFFRERKFKKDLFTIVFSFGITIIVMGSLAKISSGDFMFKGDNGSVNMLIGANNNSNGSYDFTVFEKGNAGFIAGGDTLTHFEKAGHWSKSAFNWIKTNPFRWISYIPSKLFHMFAIDDWSVIMLTGESDLYLYKLVKSCFDGSGSLKLFKERSFLFITLYVIIMPVNHVFYYTVMLLAVYQIIRIFRNRKSGDVSQFIIIYLYMFAGIASAIIAFGLPRFKYPFVVLLLLTITPIVKEYIEKKHFRLDG